MSWDELIDEDRSQHSSWDETRGEKDWALSGDNPAAQQLRTQIQRIAPYFRAALIRGDSASGKQAVARAIHALSPGANGRFVAMSASLLTDALDSKTEDTGCKSCAMGTLKTARGGTLYLTRVGDLSAEQQGTLYRFLRGADGRPGSLDSGLRVLAESHRDLRTLASIGQFRQDVYDCLAALEIVVPQLQQQVEDIPAPTEASGPDRSERLDDFVRRHVLEVLTRLGGNKRRAAQALGISRSTLYRMLEANSARLESRGEFGIAAMRSCVRPR